MRGRIAVVSAAYPSIPVIACVYGGLGALKGPLLRLVPAAVQANEILRLFALITKFT